MTCIGFTGRKGNEGKLVEQEKKVDKMARCDLHLTLTVVTGPLIKMAAELIASPEKMVTRQHSTCRHSVSCDQYRVTAHHSPTTDVHSCHFS